MTVIFSLLPLPRGSHRYVFAKRSDGVTGTYVCDEQELTRFVENHADADCYVQLNPARRVAYARPFSHDVTHVQAVLLDFDPVGMLPFDRARVLSVLYDMGVPAHSCTWIYSGRGIQCWLHLIPLSVSYDPLLGRRVRTFLDLFSLALGTLDGWRLDILGDLARLARLPGTRNTKTGEVACVLESMQFPSPGGWLTMIEPAPPPEKVCAEGQVIAWPDVAPGLTQTAYRFIVEGAVDGERHRCCVAAARSLRDVGATPDVAHALLLLGASRCSPSALSESEVERIWNQVWGRR